MTTTSYATEAERRKLDAHALLHALREVYVRRGQRALISRLLVAGTATADDVRDAVELSEGINPVCLGAVPGELARAGIIGADGFTRSTRPEAHARPVQLWRLMDWGAALRWLATHPDMPDPEPESEPDQGAGYLFDLDTNATPGAATPGGRY